MVTETDIFDAPILIVDDDDISIKLLERILRGAGYLKIQSVQDPRKVRDLYKTMRPDLIILDIHMPSLSGLEVMEQLKDLQMDDYLPVIIISGEEDKTIINDALHKGAKDYLNKPYDRDEVLLRCRNIIEVRLLHNQSKDLNVSLERKISERISELSATQKELSYRLSRAMAYRDTETGMHIERMSRYSAVLANALGWSPRECELMVNASPLHDIGKIGIRDDILLKPSKLSPDEWEIMKTHPLIGAEILGNSVSSLLKMAAEIALTHHERWDGSGYPHGLKGENIPMSGRICGIADVFDALTTKRPYKEAWSLDQTISEFQKSSGSQFDPSLVEIFLGILPDILVIKEKYVD